MIEEKPVNDYRSHIDQARRVLNEQRQEVLSRRALLDEEVVKIDRELAAITAYERVRSGREGQPKARSAQSKTASILELLRHNPTGLTRQEIMVGLGAAGDAPAERSITATLASLTRYRYVDRRGSRYMAT